jgi:hypothetical protein
VASARLGTQYDVAGERIVQGRPYGDAQGVDGDVTLVGSSARLPSFRGVSEVRFAQLDDDAELEILVGDGWHQDFGRIAEPRVSMIDEREGGFVHETLATLRPQHSVSTVRPFELDGKRYVFAAGNSRADIVDLSDRSVRNVYTSESLFFDAAFLGVDHGRVDVAIKEDDVWVVTADGAAPAP